MKQNEIAQPTLVDQSVEEVKAFRDKLKFMFENGVLPKSYLDVKANEKDKECTLISEASLNRAMATISYGKALGLTPEMSLTHCMNVNGHMSIYGDAINAIIYSSGLLKRKTEYFDEETMTAVCIIERKDIAGEETRTFSFEDAKIAGLWGKGVWRQYPKRMAQMRARGFAYRDVFPDLLHGMITTEEAMDMQLSGAGGYSDVVAVAKVKKVVPAEPVKSGVKAIPQKPAVSMTVNDFMSIDDVREGLQTVTSEKELKDYYLSIKKSIAPDDAGEVVEMFAEVKKMLKNGDTPAAVAEENKAMADAECPETEFAGEVIDVPADETAV